MRRPQPKKKKTRKGTVIRDRFGDPEYRSKGNAKGIDETEDYGRGIRYTKFGERNTTYGKTGTYQTTYGKDGTKTTRKIGKRTAADVRGSEGPKRKSEGSKKKKIRVKRRGR